MSEEKNLDNNFEENKNENLKEDSLSDFQDFDETEPLEEIPQDENKQEDIEPNTSNESEDFNNFNQQENQEFDSNTLDELKMLQEQIAQDGSFFAMQNELLQNALKETDEENEAVKKYVVYISKDFVPTIDTLSVDERSAYINDAIQLKLDSLDRKKQQKKRLKFLFHLILIFVVVCVLTPFALLLINKAMLATFENYKYSQDNFEKLYRQKIEGRKSYARSVQYNKLHPDKK